MPITLFEAGIRREEEGRERPSVVSGVVLSNFDCLAQGKVLVRIPSLDREVWARVSSTGAGSSRGVMYIPQPDDEVLVALNYGDPNDSFIVGGTWNNQDRTPAPSPTDLLTKRVIKTGMADGVGHEVEFDDALQSITITSSTKQKITIDPIKIELSNLAGTVKITLDNTTQTVTIEAAKSIELKALANIKLQAATIDIEGTVSTNVKSVGPCNITGLPVKIN